MPDWLNFSNVISTFSFLLTLVTFFNVGSIKKSFFRRARLPQIKKELEQNKTKLSNNIPSWNENKSDTLLVLSSTKAILENIEGKLPAKEKKKVQGILVKFNPKIWWIFPGNIHEVDEDFLWNLYSDLNGIITSLEQLIKDSKWD